MNHCGTQKLETGRLVLRRLTAQDADAVYKNWASDPEVTRFLTWPT
ncbi:MAG: GNAT family N-acetyltransferase, partial [Clostridia bacterium]|nr:GNAT family N-acetyltransferase [Clostridia bacterium]